MDRLFECVEANFFRVPDGTLVNPFLNPLLDGLSIAAGYIDVGTVSQIHVHPFISQVTVLLAGSLEIHMKDPGNQNPRYTRRLRLPAPIGKPGFTTAAAVALPGTLCQLDNSKGPDAAKVLYICSPGYVFEPGAYDDAIAFGTDWTRLAELDWNPPELRDPARSRAARERALQRLGRRPA
jgi:hypothetical protein